MRDRGELVLVFMRLDETFVQRNTSFTRNLHERADRHVHTSAPAGVRPVDARRPDAKLGSARTHQASVHTVDPSPQSIETTNASSGERSGGAIGPAPPVRWRLTVDAPAFRPACRPTDIAP